MSEEKKPEAAQKTELPKEKKSNNRTLWYVLAGCGGCCLLLAIFFILSGILPFLSFFHSTADIKPSPSISVTPTNSLPTAAPSQTTQSEVGQCEHLELVDSVPIDISPSDPGLKQDIDTHYYQVYGTTPTEVRTQLNECGAKSGGEGYDAYTSYYINWAYNYQPIAGGCLVKDVAVGAKIDFFYPKWEDPGNAQAGLKENWQRYMNNLETHENGHKDIALAGAQAILDALVSLPTYSTCDEAQSTANSTAQGIFNDYDARQEAYDAETNHGATQGATFP